MNKFKAFLIHFLLSLLVFLTVVMIVIQRWYPGIFFETSGVWQALRMVVLVDVGLGPLMTLILFRPHKPGLKFDLSVVAACQLVALLYGINVLYGQKPELVVFHDGMFVCLNQSQVAFAKAEPWAESSGNRVPSAFLPPFNPTQQREWAQRRTELPKGYPAHPAFVYGEWMKPYDDTSLSLVLDDDWDLSGALIGDPAVAAEWSDYQRAYPDWQQYRYFVWTCGPHQYMVAVESQRGEFIAALDIPFINATRRMVLKLRQD